MKYFFGYLLIIVLVIIACFYNKILYFWQLKESFIQEKIPDNLVYKEKISSYPLLVNANDVSQLFDYQDLNTVKNDEIYSVSRFPNVILPGPVVGCGGRRQPCYGGSQQIVNNIIPPLEISENNIAPSNINLFPLPKFQEVGYLYKIFGPQNIYLPLYQKIVGDRYPKYKYYTLDKENKIRKVHTPSVFRKLGTNDEVRIEGYPYSFRISVNEQDMPVYPRISE